MAGGISVILDTCALLWLVNNDRKLSRVALKSIREAPFVYISAISGFEIAHKESAGKLSIAKSSTDWFQEAVEQHGLTILGLDSEICVAAAQLPFHHRDPCDRFIIATALLNHLTVVTADERFEEYGVPILI
ncbi:MAG TPA: type II toxin-antitoxin system VapC family toxin [Verrucomicrobiae bacterium]|nr:type II toxin-antitoxin system VapC family toxin [Verrucomicrobiae bacterium]